MLNALYVGLGGFVGSVLRYGVNLGVYRLVREPWIPFGTVVVNIAGCFLIGLFSGLHETRGVLNPRGNAFLIIGLFGGFTTFSTFGLEIFNLSRDARYGAGFTYAALQIILGLAAVWLGHSLARQG